MTELSDYRRIVEAPRVETYETTIRSLRDDVERLTERCAAYKGQVEACAAEIERLRAALKEIATTSICGYVITKQSHGELCELVGEFYRRFKERVEMAKRALEQEAPSGREG